MYLEPKWTCFISKKGIYHVKDLLTNDIYGGCCVALKEISGINLRVWSVIGYLSPPLETQNLFQDWNVVFGSKS